jgi:hypothetical protein|tara:strand:+ start:487 stop:915 length:429 start_codon:yes stop_codon:yes gene_type:complete
MKYFILILLVSILVFSCRKPEYPGETIHDRFIENNSSHSIKIKNIFFYDVEIQSNETFKDGFISEGDSPPRISGYYITKTDSIEVIYDDTLSVFHGSKNYTMFRDLRRYDMFNFTESETNGSTHYTYTYTFTDADYDEAKTK